MSTNAPRSPTSKTILGSINFNHSCNCSGNCFDPKLLKIHHQLYGDLMEISLEYDGKIISETNINWS